MVKPALRLREPRKVRSERAIVSLDVILCPDPEDSSGFSSHKA
jgi:hypothetical protein